MESDQGNRLLFHCTKCNIKFDDLPSLQQHENSHSLDVKRRRESRHICPFCDREFSIALNLTSHMALHTGSRLHICMQCNRKYASSATLWRHKATHSKERPHACSTCGRRFLLVHDLRRHLNTHLGSNRPTFRCLKCAKKFQFAWRLRNHTKFVHGTDETAMVCKMCSKRFADVLGLRRHCFNYHSDGDGAYKCTKCTQSFLYHTLLLSHQAVHGTVDISVSCQTEFKFFCHTCNQKFKCISELRTHCATHNNMSANAKILCSRKNRLNLKPKTFCCLKCNKDFRDVVALRLHNAAEHTPRHRYRCDECDVGFMQEVYLQRHLKVHRGLVTDIVGPHLTDVIVVKPHVPISAWTHPALHLSAQQSSSLSTKHCIDQLDLQVNVQPCVKLEHNVKFEPIDIENDVNFTCSDCGIDFEIFDNLLKHRLLMVVTAGEPRFGCGHCGQMYQAADEAKTCFYKHRQKILK